MLRYKLGTLMIVLAVAPLVVAIVCWTWPPIAIVAGIPAVFLAIASWRYCRDNSLPRWFAASLVAMIALPTWLLTYLALSVMFIPFGPT
jgi:hypothetical protein